MFRLHTDSQKFSSLDRKMSIHRSSPSDAGDDSASEPEDGAVEYYEPISTEDNGVEDCLIFNDEADDHYNVSHHPHLDEQHGGSYVNPTFFGNGISSIESVRNGISVIDFVQDNHRGERRDNDDGGNEEEEERLRRASEMAITMAFREDENRRSAPLPPERSSAIVDAMRNVRFGGLHPSWANQIPEEQWIDRLRLLRREPTNPN